MSISERNGKVLTASITAVVLPIRLHLQRRPSVLRNGRRKIITTNETN